MNDTVRDIQALLKARGYSLGSTGPAKDGVDGDPGPLLFGAVLAELKKTEAAASGVTVTVAVAKSAIDLITVAVLRAACPERTDAQLLPWVEPIKAACRKFEINTIRRIAAFIAQMAHESGLIPGREENLNYSAKRLAEVWPGRYAVNPKADVKDRQPNALAKSIGGNPQAVANNVYANRMGNGDAASGDGWANRGAGPGQLTGANNWRGFATAMGMTLDQARAYGRTLEGGVMSFAWFWEENDINRLADTPGTADESRAVNGGDNGQADRKRRFDAAVQALLAAERGM